MVGMTQVTIEVHSTETCALTRAQMHEQPSENSFFYVVLGCTVTDAV
jgi:hypothetical protein